MPDLKKFFFFIIPMIIFTLLINPFCLYSNESKIKQFIADGHVLGFEKTGIYAATGSHALNIRFAGTNGVTPESISRSLGSKKALPLKK